MLNNSFASGLSALLPHRNKILPILPCLALDDSPSLPLSLSVTPRWISPGWLVHSRRISRLDDFADYDCRLAKMELGRESSTACVGSVHKRTEASRILLIHRRRSDASSVVVPFCAPLLQQKLLQKKDERERERELPFELYYYDSAPQQPLSHPAQWSLSLTTPPALTTSRLSRQTNQSLQCH